MCKLFFPTILLYLFVGQVSLISAVFWCFLWIPTLGVIRVRTFTSSMIPPSFFLGGFGTQPDAVLKLFQPSSLISWKLLWVAIFPGQMYGAFKLHGCQLKSLHGEHPQPSTWRKKKQKVHAAAWPKKKMPPFFYTQSDFFRLICVPKSLSWRKSRLCECRISYGSAPNARPSHGPSVRMEEDVRVIQATHITRGCNETPNLRIGMSKTPPKTNMDGGPQNDGWSRCRDGVVFVFVVITIEVVQIWVATGVLTAKEVGEECFGMDPSSCVDGWEMVIPLKKLPIIFGIYVKFLGCRFVVLRSQFLFFLMDTNPCLRLRWTKIKMGISYSPHRCQIAQ